MRPEWMLLKRIHYTVDLSSGLIPPLGDNLFRVGGNRILQGFFLLALEHHLSYPASSF